MKWSDIFQDPDMVGQSEYLAIHDAVAGGVLGTGHPDPERKLTREERRRMRAMLEEIGGLAGELSGRLGGRGGGLKQDRDWRRQRHGLNESQ